MRAVVYVFRELTFPNLVSGGLDDQPYFEVWLFQKNGWKQRLYSSWVGGVSEFLQEHAVDEVQVVNTGQRSTIEDWQSAKLPPVRPHKKIVHPWKGFVLFESATREDFLRIVKEIYVGRKRIRVVPRE